jgi:glycine cleavage system T protein
MQKETPLRTWHEKAGAKLAPFAGWSMPLYYPGGSIAEHRMVRRSIGLFDISHMARFQVSGPQAEAFLQLVLSANVGSVAVGGSTYSLLCRPDGGIMDDVFVYHLPDHWMVVANAANAEKDFTWIVEHSAPFDTTITDISGSTGMIAVQGPLAVEMLDTMTPTDLAGVKRFYSTAATLGGTELIAGRTGYTGEDGFEFFVPAEHLERVWVSILESAGAAGVESGPVGLAARDSLRFEPGFPLYGHELDESLTPVEARLTWACDLEKDFIGRDAIRDRKKVGPSQKLVTMVMKDKGLPRQGYPVFHDADRVGKVVSGMYCPTVDKYCANAYVLPDVAKNGTLVSIEIRGNRKDAETVKRPLYKPAYK